MKKVLMIVMVSILCAAHPGYSGEKAGIKVTAVGDIMMGTDFPDRYKILPDDDGAALFGHVSDILSRGDIIFGNLEQVLSDNGQCAKDISRPNMWAFRAPARYAENLKRANFNVMGIANNHA